jgi:hypothetical protein
MALFIIFIDNLLHMLYLFVGKEYLLYIILNYYKL